MSPALDGPDARRRLAGARVARMATVDAHGRPRVVPVCFAVDGERVYWAVDDKPKAAGDIARVRDLAANANVTVLVDHYDEDWSQLWWVRARGQGQVLAAGADADRARGLLRDKYEQYRSHALATVVAVTVEEVRGWSAV